MAESTERTDSQVVPAVRTKVAEKDEPIRRTNDGRFLKGFSANPGARVGDVAKGRILKNRRALIDAIRDVEKELDETGQLTLLKHAVRQAFDDNTVLIAVLRKIVPDLKAIEIDGRQDTTWRVLLTNFADAIQGDKPDGH